MAGINFPGGYTFDPATGEISGNGIPRSTSSGGRPRASTRTNTSSRSYYSSSNLSLWDRLNNFVIGIGNWIARSGESAMSYIAFGCLGLAWLGFVIGIIAIWIDEGFIWAVVVAIFGGGIWYILSGLALALFFFIDDFILLIVRYIFYNIYTLLVAIVLLVGPVVLDAVGHISLFSDSDSAQVEMYEPESSPNIYVCTASSALNVRSAPNTSSYVVGTLRPGQEREVLNFVSGFAKIRYGGQIAYASSEYLRKK